jgi:hypothetical protein
VIQPQQSGPSDCLPKTQVCAKPKGDVYGLTPAQCQKVNGRGEPGTECNGGEKKKRSRDERQQRRVSPSGSSLVPGFSSSLLLLCIACQGQPRTEALVNGGRNYNGPKVAKFLVG